MKLIGQDEVLNHFEDYKGYCETLNMEQVKECPICHVKILPSLLGDCEGAYQYVLLGCPNCKEMFVMKYEAIQIGMTRRYDYILRGIYPKNAKSANIKDNIAKISPMFVEIYNQAAQAESDGLDQISGIGYRKSIEFLIKDYLKYKNPEDHNKKEEIESKMLGKCIKMIDNENIKSMAERAVWLGNDETHYVRKWENKDINDLKALIKLTLAWMELELLTDEYSVEMV